MEGEGDGEGPSTADLEEFRFKPLGWILNRFGKVGGGSGKLGEAISKDLGLNARKGWEELGRIGDSWTKSWGKLRQAEKSLADDAFVHSCAFRSPARSGLMALGAFLGSKLGHVGLMLASWPPLGPLFLCFRCTCVRSCFLKQLFSIFG